MSLGLRLYLAAAKRSGKARNTDVSRLARPAGKLVWLHISGPQDIVFAKGLVTQLAEDLVDVSFLLTTPNGMDFEASFQGDYDQPCLHIAAPEDTPEIVAEFLDYWQPSVAIWTGTILRPALLVEAQNRRIPRLMLNAQNRASIADRSRLIKGVIRTSLGLFDHILATHDSIKSQLISQGADKQKIQVGDLIKEVAEALYCDDRDRDDMAQTLAARPVWLAAHTDQTEDHLVASAHRTAMRLSHRLLLILAPDNPARGTVLAQSLTNDGWLVAQRSLDQEPDEHVQIFIADEPDEMGLWLRLAPVCFMGNSLSQGATGCAPNPASALGSAILHGPYVSDFKSQYAHLDAMNAAREVTDKSGLVAAVQDLLAPDKAAEMAHAGWEISTSGAEAMERAMALIYDSINQNEAP